MNATTKAIIDQLPKKPLLAPADISAAYGLKRPDAVVADIKAGRLGANKVGGKYIISLDAAVAYVKSNEFHPDEGTLTK